VFLGYDGNQNVLERAFYAKKMMLIDTQAEGGKILWASSFDPAETVVANSLELRHGFKNFLETRDLIIEIPYNEPMLETSNIIEITEYNFNSVKISTSTEEEGFLILSDIYYPGWKAKIDNDETDVFEANLALRGIYLPSGQHEIEFFFEPSSLQKGATISIITIVAISIYSWIVRNKNNMINNYFNNKS